MAEKVILEVEVKSSKASKDIKKVGSGSKTAAKETTLLSIAMGGVKKAMLAIKTTSKLLFGSIKAGLISTGIGIFVVLIGSLFAWFSKTKKGAEKLEMILAVVGATITVVVNRVAKFGSAIAKFFKGDFKGAAKDMKAAFSGVGAEIKNNIKTTQDLTRAQQELRDTTRDLTVQTARQKSEIEALRLIGEDITKTDEERLVAMQSAFDMEQKLMDERVANAAEHLRLLKVNATMSDNMADDLDELAQAEIALHDIRAESAAKQVGLNNFLNGLKAQNHAKSMARKQERMDKEKEAADDHSRIVAMSSAILQKQYYSQLDNAEELDRAIRYTALVRAKREVEASKATERAKFVALGLLESEFQRVNLLNETKYQDERDAIALQSKEATDGKLRALEEEHALVMEEDANERALLSIEQQRNNELDAVVGMERETDLKAAINKKYNQKITAQNKATSDASRKFGKGDLAAIGSMFGAAANLQETGSKGWKKNKIAEARIGSVMGAMSAYNSLAAIPVVGVGLGIIAAALALKTGQAQVDEINATEIPPATGLKAGGLVGGYGNGTSDSVNAKLSRGEVVINAKSAKMFRGALSRMNVAGGGIGFARGGATTTAEGLGLDSVLSDEPLRAFVITDDLTDSQDKLAQIRRRSNL